MNPVNTTANVDIERDKVNEHLIILHFKNMWTWHECRDAMQVAMYMQETSDRPFSYIYDLTESKLASRTLMENVKKLIELVLSPAPEKIVIVDKGMKLQLMVDMLERLFPQKLKENIVFADSLKQAKAVIGD